ncbi:DNA (cytosine-5-)-methyltransferase [Vibrio parahaemolyticus]|uniref:DNA (cytosine-5-)-methyltransferase n=1 Tax=Vibrio parahaemolyticus TaxID=670 RepID=UPI0022697DF8|nr:DNA (cytosine-5-)-methyltransferase [Vibrio parahaemolyticus]EGU4189122.1 DNA (cytosine-5-)-methyltransferase [Vibrio parahaemolyticus]EJG0908006.1 DNA (cytosine-5-)-methyltransferase [Vibrio parahaemolyticus]ELA9844205.1 DNA (cytosine-5-)-methyltransferase [Vibrio parahaemolyticus]MCX8786405.1 DNA (cytosine-5-)-methyltransferase [Vibrio parahaemolyticus]MCX8846496.1 DNA (cytosine-5-)-methyltransferase [Vibrio parahaemolyticus]
MKFIDLFAGMGGTRIGFEQACKEKGIKATCVFTSEIKEYAKSIYEYNFKDEVSGDITSIESTDIPDFDFLLGGFPCQAFSSAGKRHGFEDSRGTLFFHIARILKEKKPKGFLLENVPGLVTHPKRRPGKETGETLETILTILEELGYKVSWSVLDSSKFGIAQKRERIYITGHLDFKPNLSDFNLSTAKLGDILEQHQPCQDTPFRRRLLSLYDRQDLYGKSIKDKRGGPTNIHSWDLELKGPVSPEQKTLMGMLLKQRRQKKWAAEIGIAWMDGMPLTLDQIATFYTAVSKDELQTMLDDLVRKDYIKFEHPKELIHLENGTTKREPDSSKPRGYNIVTGKLSFELNKILDPNCISNTIVATETSKLGVLDTDGIRTLTDRECLRLFGFPDEYKVNIKQRELYDLIGNTVVVPVIKEVAKKII